MRVSADILSFSVFDIFVIYLLGYSVYHDFTLLKSWVVHDPTSFILFLYIYALCVKKSKKLFSTFGVVLARHKVRTVANQVPEVTSRLGNKYC